jgi:hypothetical protein
MTLEAVPMTVREANEFIASFHRHNKPVVGARFAIGCTDGTGLMGVAVVGRPVARQLQDGATSEVTRCCVLETAPKGACSFLYAACWRAWRAMGGASAYHLHACQRERRIPARRWLACRGRVAGEQAQHVAVPRRPRMAACRGAGKNPMGVCNMTSAELLALAARVETEEPSEKLDFDILDAITPRGTSWKYRPYTTSLDAAASLMPSTVQEVTVRNYPTGTVVRATTASGAPVYSEVLRGKPAEPQARTAAALRAKAQERP